MGATVAVDDIEGIKALVSNDWSEWSKPIEVTQAMINGFADVTRDHQWIHVDVEKAKAGPFGGPIAHGFLTLSLIPKFLEDIGPNLTGAAGGLNYGADKLRFLSPVPVDTSVHARMRVLSVTEKGSGIQMKYEIAVHNVGNDTPALVYEMIVLVFGG